MNLQFFSAVCGCALVLSAGVAQAQNLGDAYQEAVPPPEVYETTNNKAIDRRLDRTEKALRELRAIVLKAQAQGAPVEVRPAGPDPILTDLQVRFADLEASVRNLTGQNEALRFDLEQAKRQSADALAEVRALSARVDALSTATPDAAGPDEFAAPAPDGGDEASAYQQARALIDSGDLTGGAAAMQVFVQRYPSSSRVPTAHYRMGRAYAGRNDHGQAAGAFAQSLKGWPQASWASDATVQLAGSLVAIKRTGDACRALAEFDSRYAAKASANVKAQAERNRQAANCR